MKKIILMIIGLTVAILVFISGPGCGNQWILFYDKPITGRVVDAETGDPIENVVVISMWQLTQYLSHGHGGYAKITVTKTDKDGTFQIPFWITFKPWKWNSSVDEYAPKLVFYKPGFNLCITHRILWERDAQDMNMTAQEKKKLKEDSSINPAKLERVYADEAIWNAFEEFEAARAPYEYFSKKQLRELFNQIKKGAKQLPYTSNKAKEKIMKDVEEYAKYWLEGKR